MTTTFYIAYFIVAYLFYVLMDKTIETRKDQEGVKFFTFTVLALVWPVVVVLVILLTITGAFRRNDK